MLFDRFVFVLYILFSYSWFLLGTLYETPFRFVPIVSMGCSMFSVCVVTFFQLQTLVRKHRLIDSEQWSTIAWSVIHIILCSMLCVDGLELTNTLVMFCIAGVFITMVIATVGMCSCLVIVRDTDDDGWWAHVHLTCICFWVLVQYMSIRLPSDDLHYITTIPVALMALLRVVEHLEEGCYWSTVAECLLFFAAVILHVCRDVASMSPTTFFWGTTASVCFMILFSKNLRPLTLVIGLPFFAGAIGVVYWDAFVPWPGCKTNIVRVDTDIRRVDRSRIGSDARRFRRRGELGRTSVKLAGAAR